MTLDAVGAAWFVLDMSLRALAAALAVALVLRLLRVRAAAVLHAAWSAVLFAMLLMPVLPSIVPALPVPVPAAIRDYFDAASGGDETPLTAVEEPVPSASAGNAGPSTQGRQLARAANRLPAPDPGSRASWSGLAIVALPVYGAGALLCLVRLSYGWLMASAMARRAMRRGPILADVWRAVYESAEVTVPMTVGALRPVIILPAAWRAWDSETLAAIIAHEEAHVRRHDGAIAFAAHLNRAMFWFHPLAWWLERTLAVTAEHACDEAAARAIAAPGRYAAMLVDMADIVRRNGGRRAWQAVGVHGAGLLDTRIDRLLTGDAFASASRRTQVAAWIGCVAAIGTVVACRQQGAAAPLREDAALATRLASQDQSRKRFEAARDMTQAQADALEQRLDTSPEDFEARRQLVTYYRTSSTVAWDAKLAGLRRHALWLIEHHPEHEVQAPSLSPQFDPEGFAAARTLWASRLARPDASPWLVFRAAAFFALHDKPYAEQLILRGMALDPDSTALTARMPPGVGGYQWPAQLAALYGAALRGSQSAWGTYADLRTHPDRLSSAYAAHVRARLEATTDARLLSRVGEILIRPNPSSQDPSLAPALDEVRRLGVRYLERALALDPSLQSARATLVRSRLSARATDADRLANRALEGYMVAEDITEYARKDSASGQRQRDEAAAQARDALKMAAAHAHDPAYSAAIMTAHHVLAMAALRDGDRERALHHLRESVNVPASEQLQYAAPFSWLRPVNRLLTAGERDRVAEFLEALARLTLTERDRLLEDAKAIREGRMPSSYQHTLARDRP
jgi:hypothetical protein